MDFKKLCLPLIWRRYIVFYPVRLTVCPVIHLPSHFVCAQFFGNHLLQSLHISHGDCSLWQHGPYWFWVQKVKGQGHNILLCKIGFLVNILRTIYRWAFIFHMLIGLYEDMIPIDFGFSRSKDKFTVFVYVKLVYRSISWGPSIAEPSYFTWWLLSMRTWSLLILGSVG